MQRTGASSTHAARATSGWTDWSSFPPKPPPQAVGRIRTRSGCDAEHVGHLVPVHVGGLGACRDLDPAAFDATRPARFRLDIGVLDEGGLEPAAGLDESVVAGRRHCAGVHAPAGEHVVGVSGLDGRGARRDRLARVAECGQRLPHDGEPVVGKPVDGVLVADDRRHRLPAVARDTRTRAPAGP